MSAERRPCRVMPDMMSGHCSIENQCRTETELVDRQFGEPCCAYHGGISAEERARLLAESKPTADYARGRADALRDAVAAIERRLSGNEPDYGRFCEGLKAAVAMLEKMR